MEIVLCGATPTPSDRKKGWTDSNVIRAERLVGFVTAPIGSASGPMERHRRTEIAGSSLSLARMFAPILIDESDSARATVTGGASSSRTETSISRPFTNPGLIVTLHV
jgi:hypothetical protein